MSLLNLLQRVHLDDQHSYMHQVIFFCTEDAETLARLSGVSTFHHRLCQPHLAVLHSKHITMTDSLLQHLGYLHLEQLQYVRSLTIPDALPGHLRLLLGKWLRAEGRLSKVSSLRRESWIRSDKINPWIRIMPIQLGDCTSPTNSYLLEKLDTDDGLIKTVLSHAHSKIDRVRMEYCFPINAHKYF